VGLGGHGVGKWEMEKGGLVVSKLQTREITNLRRHHGGTRIENE